MRRSRLIVAVAIAALALSCATRFSPQAIRNEILRQQGQDPLKALEIDLGRFTTMLLKQALAGENGELPFAGLSGLQLAVYDAPGATGPAIDVTKMAVTGWESVMRAHDETRSGMVLVRGSSSGPDGRARIADLVIVGAGAKQVVYARLWGSLDPALPQAMSDVLRDGGPERVRAVVSELAGGASAPAK